jgi:hypothetical protein
MTTHPDQQRATEQRRHDEAVARLRALPDGPVPYAPGYEKRGGVVTGPFGLVAALGDSHPSTGEGS